MAADQPTAREVIVRQAAFDHICGMKSLDRF